jgi:hypothetical protein
MFGFEHHQRRTCLLATLLVAFATLIASPLDYRVQSPAADNTSETPQCRDLSAEADQVLFRTSAEAKNHCPRRGYELGIVAWIGAIPVATEDSVLPSVAEHVPGVKLCENARHCRSGIQLS